MDFARSLRRFRALLWVLIGLIPVQGMATSVLATLGPAHVHRTVGAAPVELEDFRRSLGRVAPRATHVHSAIGHFHRSIEPSRHHHPRGEPTVVRVADDAANQIGDEEGSNVSAALGALVSMPPNIVTWLASASTDVAMSGDHWPLLTHHPDPLERPPRRD